MTIMARSLEEQAPNTFEAAEIATALARLCLRSVRRERAVAARHGPSLEHGNCATAEDVVRATAGASVLLGAVRQDHCRGD